MGQSNAVEFKKGLEAEGFVHLFLAQDPPGKRYPDHTHQCVTAHIIVDGEMTLTVNGVSRTYPAGERCDVPSGAVHSARMGPSGCHFIVGQK